MNKEKQELEYIMEGLYNALLKVDKNDIERYNNLVSDAIYITEQYKLERMR